MAKTAARISRKRVDQLLVDRGMADSRSKAQALVMAGAVFHGERRIDKPGATVPDDGALAVRGRDHPWVSRGGLKLAHGIERFGVDPAGGSASISAPRPAASPMSCSAMAQRGSMPSMSATASSPGNCAPIRA